MNIRYSLIFRLNVKYVRDCSVILMFSSSTNVFILYATKSCVSLRAIIMITAPLCLRSEVLYLYTTLLLPDDTEEDIFLIQSRVLTLDCDPETSAEIYLCGL